MPVDVQTAILDTLLEIKKSLERRSDIDQWQAFNTAVPWIMDYRHRDYVYIWSPSTFTLSLEEYGTLEVQATVWTVLNLPEGVRITGTTTQNALLRFTDTLLTPDAQTLYGTHSTPGDTALLLDVLGQVAIEDFIRYQIMAGHGFRATTGLLSTGTGSNNFICMQAAVNNIAKHVLFYSLVAANTNVTGEVRLYTASAATADSGLTTALTAFNQQPKSTITSTLTTLVGSPAGSTETSGFQGSLASVYSSVAGQATQLLQNLSLVYFAPGDTASVEIANKIPTTGNSASLTMEWIEW